MLYDNDGYDDDDNDADEYDDNDDNDDDDNDDDDDDDGGGDDDDSLCSNINTALRVSCRHFSLTVNIALRAAAGIVSYIYVYI